MRLKLFTLKFNSALACFDEQTVLDFLNNKVVLQIKEYFFTHDTHPYLLLKIVYQLADEREEVAIKKQPNDDYKRLLTQESTPLFDTLRAWRAESSHQAGIPPYVICNNKQLAQIATSKPNSLNDLMQIEGIGKAKIERWGEAIIRIIATAST